MYLHVQDFISSVGLSGDVLKLGEGHGRGPRSAFINLRLKHFNYVIVSHAPRGVCRPWRSLEITHDTQIVIDHSLNHSNHDLYLCQRASAQSACAGMPPLQEVPKVKKRPCCKIRRWWKRKGKWALWGHCSLDLSHLCLCFCCFFGCC